MSDFKKFAAEISKKKFERAYLISGNEEYFVSRAIELLTESVVKVDERSFNLDVFDGTDTDSEAILSSMLSFPFVGEHRLTIVRRFDKMERKFRADVADHLPSVPEMNVVCLATGDIKISDEPYATIASHASTVTFNKLKGSELSQFITENAISLGKEMSAASADMLVDFTGDSLGDLTAELEKLSLYVADRKKIDAEDVSAVVGKSRTFNIFELQRAISQRNPKRAHEIAGKMLESGEKPVYINFMLSRFFLNLLQVKHLLAKGIKPKDVSASIFGKWNASINDYTAAAREFSTREIKEALGVLLDVDLKLKTGGYKGPDAMVVLVSEIMGTDSHNKTKELSRR